MQIRVTEKIFSKQLHSRLYEEVYLEIGEVQWSRNDIVKSLGISASPAISRVGNILKRLNIRTIAQLHRMDPGSLAATKGFGEMCMFVVTAILEANNYNVLAWWGYDPKGAGNTKFSSFKHRIITRASKRRHAA